MCLAHFGSSPPEIRWLCFCLKGFVSIDLIHTRIFSSMFSIIVLHVLVYQELKGGLLLKTKLHQSGARFPESSWSILDNRTNLTKISIPYTHPWVGILWKFSVINTCGLAQDPPLELNTNEKKILCNIQTILLYL